MRTQVTSPEERHLSRRFTPFHMLLLSINGMVGSAWLFAPLYAAKIAGAAAISAWVLGGLATILIALTFAEISTMLPVVGGTTRFAQLSHGTTTGFVISWVSWLSCVTMPPIEVQAVLQYASTYFSGLTHLVHDVPVLTGLGLFYAALIMLALCVINIASFRGFVGFNFIIIAFKLLVIAAVILFFVKTQFITAHFTGAWAIFDAHTWHMVLSAVATGGIAFAFTGFKHGVELAGETKNSQVAVPLSIVGSVTVCLLLYLGLQIAFIGALPPATLTHGWSEVAFSGDVGPFVGIAAILGLGWLMSLLYVDAAISPLGAGLIYVTSTARLIYAMSKNGYFSKIFTRLNAERFPVWAIGLNFIVGMLLFLPLPGWQAMVSFLVSAVVISYAMGPIALLCLRKQMPNEKRSFRLPCATPLCWIAFYCCNLISYWTGWDTIWKLAIAVAIGLVVYFLACARGVVDRSQLGLRALGWLMPYLLGLLIISYLGSFGGKEIISFGWDFLVIAIFSSVIFYLAIALHRKDIKADYKQYQFEGAVTAN